MLLLTYFFRYCCFHVNLNLIFQTCSRRQDEITTERLICSHRNSFTQNGVDLVVIKPLSLSLSLSLLLFSSLLSYCDDPKLYVGFTEYDYWFENIFSFVVLLYKFFWTLNIIFNWWILEQMVFSNSSQYEYL